MGSRRRSRRSRPEVIGSDANSGIEENEDEDKTMSWIAVAISLAVIIGIQAHKSFAKYMRLQGIFSEREREREMMGEAT